MHLLCVYVNLMTSPVEQIMKVSLIHSVSRKHRYYQNQVPYWLRNEVLTRQYDMNHMCRSPSHSPKIMSGIGKKYLNEQSVVDYECENPTECLQ